MPEGGLRRLRVGTDWVPLRIVSEPSVVVTARGYIPVVYVQHLQTGEAFELRATAVSIADGLEPLRLENDGSLVDVEVRIRRTSTEQTAPYEVETVGATTLEQQNQLKSPGETERPLIPRRRRIQR